jgi:hypothetical protein
VGVLGVMSVIRVNRVIRILRFTRIIRGLLWCGCVLYYGVAVCCTGLRYVNFQESWDR